MYIIINVTSSLYNENFSCIENVEFFLIGLRNKSAEQEGAKCQ